MVSPARPARSAPTTRGPSPLAAPLANAAATGRPATRHLRPTVPRSSATGGQPGGPPRTVKRVRRAAPVKAEGAEPASVAASAGAAVQADAAGRVAVAARAAAGALRSRRFTPPYVFSTRRCSRPTL